MDKGAGVKGEDVAVARLVPLQERRASQRGYQRLLASIRAVGLIEPLCVYEEAGQYVILDGYLRYRACRELGIDNVPCLLLPTKEAYTCNRMVNNLSPVQETRMLNQSLETIDESTIAKALGLVSIKHRLKDKLLKQLHPDVVHAFDQKSIPLRVCAGELTHVKPSHQAAILKEMHKAGDFSAAYARTLVLRAPVEMRIEKGRRKSPWHRGAQQKKALATKLEQAEQRYEFYSGLYRQYVADLMKLCIHVRGLISNKRIAAYMTTHHSAMFDRFQEIIFEKHGRKVV